jgi:hypothetical protein
LQSPYRLDPQIQHRGCSRMVLVGRLCQAAPYSLVFSRKYPEPSADGGVGYRLFYQGPAHRLTALPKLPASRSSR